MERLKGKPFALLGVNTDAAREKARQEDRRRGINWRSWWDGGVNGPVATAWQINGLPGVVVLDHRGVVRQRDLDGPALERAVERLLKRTENDR